MDAPWAASADAVLKAHKVTAEKGLTSKRVEELRAKFGPNELDKEEGTPLWKLVLDQFDDLLVKILLGAACLSFALAFAEHPDERMQAFVEPFVILLILVLNAIVGVWQEHNAENALEALKQMQECTAQCVRDGVLEPEVPAADLVPGDVVHVNVGDKVPADVRVVTLKTTSVRTDEGALTGESETVSKTTGTVGKDARIQDKRNMMFSGTTVSNGNCVAVVVSTGMRTEIGKIQEHVQAAAEDEEKTPLGQKIDAFGELLAKVIFYICVAVWFMNYKQFSDPVHGGFWKGLIYYLKIAVALGVAAIPEGLPAVITLCLALGTRKMVKRNAIVRKLPSVETLGCTTVICTDKTGTLTTNQMTVVAVATPGAKANALVEKTVTGTSYAPAGVVEGLKKPEELAALAQVCSLCNQASVHYDAAEEQYVRVGEPTEAALAVLVEKIGVAGSSKPTDPADACKAANASWASGAPHHATLEFSRDRKSMSTLCGYDGSKRRGPKNKLYVKGAPERVLERCTSVRLADGSVAALKAADRAAVLKKVAAMAARPLRCLAMAVREDVGALADYDGPTHKAHASLTDPSKFVELEKDLVFVGVCGIKDPARPEVAPAIAACGTAGIRVVMITGDTKPTAEAIAKEVGIFEEGDDDLDGRSFTGADFFKLSEKKRVEALTAHRRSMVFSRTEPKDKQALVKMLRAAGEVPAMTGDGVNDAPALKQAHIGIAVEGSTDAARNAADIVLTTEGLAPIFTAVLESRKIFQRVYSYVLYRISATIQIVLVLSLLIFIWNQTIKPLYIIILALFNDLTMITISYDNVIPSRSPEQPTINKLLRVSGVFGGLMTVQSLLFMILGTYTDFLTDRFNDSDGYRQAVLYLQISLSIEGLIFATRVPEAPCYSSAPVWSLVVSVLVANVLVTVIVGLGLLGKEVAINDLVIVWAYDVVWFGIIDLLKIPLTMTMENHFPPPPSRLGQRTAESTAEFGGRAGDGLGFAYVDLGYTYLSDTATSIGNAVGACACGPRAREEDSAVVP
mmetsp:Transcript_22732/g.68138  ORF Transcript_22732/g.68138 Transcript_22732/m.68138 type:complete len:1025 (+) Transcript_22732:146-3220(+)